MHMKPLLFFAIYIWSAGFVYSQKNSEENKTYNLSAKFGIGITKFAVTGFETEDYPAMATRLGFAISKAVIGNRVLVESGLNAYLRAKSKSPLVEEIYWYGKGSRLPLFDATATERHVAFEIPFTLKYLMRGDKSLNTGLILRQYGSKKPKEVNLLASQTELGFTIGIAQKVINDFSIGLDIFIGLNDFYHIGIIGSTGDVKVKSRSALFSIAYAL